MLEVARQIGKTSGMTVRTTLLAAHTVPPEYVDEPDAYIDMICNELIPRVTEQGLADAVDAYCESIAFSAEQVARLFECATEAGLAVKLHADQLSACGGAELAAQFNALSADHLEHSSIGGIEAMARAGTTAVLLPGAFLTLGETQCPPVAALREKGVAIAVATDCNPGTANVDSMPFVIALSVLNMGLTADEAVWAATLGGARALGLDDRGRLVPGAIGDLVVLDAPNHLHIAYRPAADVVAAVVKRGEIL